MVPLLDLRHRGRVPARSSLGLLALLLLSATISPWQSTVAAQQNRPPARGASPAAVPPAFDPKAFLAANEARPTAKMEVVFNSFLPNTYNQHFDQVAMDAAGNIILGVVCRGVPGIMKLDKGGNKVIFKTFVAPENTPKNFCSDGSRDNAPNSNAWFRSLAVGKDGSIYGAGLTTSPGYFATNRAARPRPVTSETERAMNQEGFLFKLTPDGRSVEYSTLWGGSNNEQINGIAVDDSGGVWAVGYTYSKDFPRISTLFDFTEANPAYNAFVTYFDPAGKPRFSSFLGQGMANDVTLLKDHVLIAGNAYGASKNKELATKIPSFGQSKDAYGNSDSGGTIWKVNRNTKQLDDATMLSVLRSRREGRNVPIWVDIQTISADQQGLFINGKWQRTLSDVWEEFPKGPGNPEQPAKVEDVNYHFVGKLAPDLKQFQLAKTFRMLQFDAVRAAPGGTFYGIGGLVDSDSLERYKTYGVWPKMRRVTTIDDANGFVVKFDPDGASVWSTLFDANVLTNTISERAYRSVMAVNDEELTILTRTTSSIAPTTADALITEGAPAGLGNKDPGGFMITKFRTATNPSADTCRYWSQPATINLTNQGGQDMHPFIVASRGDCKWSLKTPDAWVKAVAPAEMIGTSAIKVDVESNYDERRTGKIQIVAENGKIIDIPIIQSTIPQQVTLSRVLVELNSKDANATSLSVQCPEANCEWAISSTADWIKIDGPASRKGAGELKFRTLANTTGDARSAILTIGTKRITVAQGTEDVPGESNGAAPAAAKPTTRPVVAPVKKPVQK